MHKRAFVDDYRGLPLYRKMGYIPCDLEEESVSKTLEYDYNDWAVACVAERVGETADAELLRKRSRNYRNYWDASTGFLRPKFESGAWATPFDPIEMGHSKKWRDYTESNAWQTTFGVQHDVTRYIALLGGDEAFVAKLDALFNQPLDAALRMRRRILPAWWASMRMAMSRATILRISIAMPGGRTRRRSACIC
jgi:putative alpha-1,2-mannosidase